MAKKKVPMKKDRERAYKEEKRERKKPARKPPQDTTSTGPRKKERR